MILPLSSSICLLEKNQLNVSLQVIYSGVEPEFYSFDSRHPYTLPVSFSNESYYAVCWISYDFLD